jgi:hypothetical protein
MKDSKIIFHCGLPKTGTSSIQSFFSAYQNQLTGILAYPGHNSPAGNADWMIPLIINNRLMRIKAEAQEAQRTAPIVLFSSENLYHAIRFSPGTFAELIRELDATVILYLPSIRDFLLSSLNQLIRNHCHATTKVDDRLMRICDYTQPLMQLEKDLGRDYLSYFRYDRNIFPKGNVLLHFLNAVGIRSQAIMEQAENFKDRNVSLSPLSLGLLLEMAQGGMTLQAPELQNQIRQLLQMYTSKLSEHEIVTPFTIGPEYQSLIASHEKIFSDHFQLDIQSDFNRKNVGVCTPVSEKHWDGLLKEIDPANKELLTSVQELRRNAQHYRQYINGNITEDATVDHDTSLVTPLTYTVTLKNLCQRMNLRSLWESQRGFLISEDGKIHLPESTEPIIIDLPQMFPILSLYLSIKIAFQSRPIHSPRLYWSTIESGTLNKKNSCPMQTIGENVFGATVLDPLYDGSVSIWMKECPESLCIESIEISFSSECLPTAQDRLIPTA